mmetsp:Transcript_43342/g.101670  ORF Transcript_43342/g.101670 Transcript_43342/m.101670 type:complete len:109 (-) Transcript_43342:100-426(-)
MSTPKVFEGRDATIIQRKEKDTYPEQVADALAAVRSVNKTDAEQLLSQFGSFRGIVSARMDELTLCPGIGDKKVRRLYDAFHKPFSSLASKKRKEQEAVRKAGKDNAL